MKSYDRAKEKEAIMTEINTTPKMTEKTGNDAPAHAHSFDHHLEFFSKGGSIRGKETYYHGLREDPVQLFQHAWYVDSSIAMKLLFWCRDCRGGAGSRETFRKCINWLAKVDSAWVSANIDLIPQHGRWDDLKALYDTPCEDDALRCWATGLMAEPAIAGLAAKWAGRQDFKLRKWMQMSPKEYRKFVVERTGWVVEHNMCGGKWEDIEYNHVPSVAGARYRNAFTKHDQTRYENWCKGLADNNTAKAKALFPHDIVRLVKSTQDQNEAFVTLANSLFENLPNYIENPDIKIMPICDFSASMGVQASGSITCFDVSLALGMYCSDRLGKNNPFYRKLIPFSSDSKLESWKDQDVAKAVRTIPNGYMGSTNIKGALDNLLNSAKMWNVRPEDMVSHLLILSDMQWDQGTHGSDESVINACMKEWELAGYKRPTIVYWNLHAYGNQPATKHERGVAMVSGFSPSVLKTVLSGEDIDPVKIMLASLEKYDIITP
jgi:hypothetical protein